jgi:2'-5' RNA ligase
MAKQISIPGYTSYDYMIILNPPEDLREKITNVRDAFNEQFKVKAPSFKPNLLLASFTQYEMKEERIVNRLKTIAMGHYPFKVELKDFGSFPSHTIYIAVTSKLPVQDLIKNIRTNAQSLMKFDDDNKPYFASEPHMTIAKKLLPWQYEKAWLEYSRKHFTGRFIADAMLLLKKREGESHWQIVRSFKFENLPVSTTQGDLFQ